VTETLEHTARKIAEQGRDALVARLRPAFEEAAATHGEGLNLDDEQLERMVQRAADRADGLQWRRALAQVATEHLGIGLGEALSHPAVARAQAIVGAPSYEDALGKLASERPAAGATDEAKAETDAEPKGGEPAADDEPEAEEPEAHEAEALEPAAHEAEAEKPEPEQPAAEAGEDDAEDDEAADDGAQDDDAPRDPTAEQPASPAPAPSTAAPPSPPPASPSPPPASPSPPPASPSPPPVPGDPAAVRLRAVHLGGIANLAPAEGDLELHLSDAGLDIMRGPERTPLGRLAWDEIVALETPPPGGRFRRKKQADAHLVVKSAQGSASFEVPGVTSEELNEHITPMLARHQK
jgi:hypothetical protein